MQKAGNRYLRLAAASLIMACIGIIYMWSVFGGFVIKEFDWTVADSALTASIMIACFSIGGLVGGKVQDRIGPKKVVVGGTIGFFFGVFLSSFAVAAGPGALYLCFGVIGGFSVGCIYNGTMASIQKWFPDKINMAMGVIVTCFGLATVIFSPVVSIIAGATGIVQCFRIVAVIFLVLCLLGSLMIGNPPEGWQPEGFQSGHVDLSQDQYTLKEALKTPQMWIIFLSIWFLTAGFFTFNPILQQLAVARGLDPAFATATVMITGIGMACGRLLFPLVVNKLGRRNTALVLAVLVLLTSLGLIVAQGPVFVVLVFLAAASAGAPGAIWPTWTAENFGLANNGANYGFVLLGIGLSSLLSFRIADAIARACAGGADYVYFIVASVMAILSIVLIAVFKTRMGKDTNR
jgi:OFA family oxalate/formate antiporter-like MFS transporter